VVVKFIEYFLCVNKSVLLVISLTW